MVAAIGADRVGTNVSDGAGATGRGVLLGHWDRGHARRSHEALAGRVSARDFADDDDHATHTLASAIGDGVDEPDARGAAPEAQAWTHDWRLDLAELRAEAAWLVLGAHPYAEASGWSIAPECNDRPTWWGGDGVIEDAAFGRYGVKAAALDRLVHETGVLSVWPAGNQRLDMGVEWGERHYHAGSCQDLHTDLHVWDTTLQYDTIGEDGLAKNTLAIGAVHDIAKNGAPIVALDASGWGPTDDGRIKPDLVVPAARVLSASSASDSAYVERTGTSSATMFVAGVAALLVEVSRRELDRDLDAAALRALLVHAARDADGVPGPDARTGWGLVDARASAALLKTDGAAASDAARLRIGVVDEAGPVQLQTAADVASGMPLRVTLAWTDPPAAPNLRGVDDATPVLINDLDVELVGPDGTTFRPWSLDVASPDAPARNDRRNRVDNLEVIDVAASDNRDAGRWRVRVSAGQLLRDQSQAFALVASAPLTPLPEASRAASREVQPGPDAIAFDEPPCVEVDLGSRLGQALVRGETTGGDDLVSASCGGDESGEVRAAWTAPSAGRFAFALRNAHFDALVYLLASDCDGDMLVCGDNATNRRVERTFAQGERVVVVVDGRGPGAAGDFELDITSLDASCADACGQADPGGVCRCDEACIALGDCCDDACAACGHCPCASDCSGRECGDDGCGGRCGVCGTGERCDDGACEVDPCADVVCAACERCDEGACVPAGDGALCEDGDPCTVMDRCEDDVCRGAPKNCDDGVACTIDACDPQTGACRARPDRTCCERMVDCDSGDCTELVRACIVTLGDAGAPDVDAGGDGGGDRRDAAVDGGGDAAHASSHGGGCGCALAREHAPRHGWLGGAVALLMWRAVRRRRRARRVIVVAR